MTTQQVYQVVDQLFPVYDRNRSGFLEAKELGSFLTAALKRVGVNATVTDSQAEQALRVMDKNKDNEVSKAEAAEALLSILDYKRQRNQQNGNTGGTSNNSWSQSQVPQVPQMPQMPPQQNEFSANNGWGSYGPGPGNTWGPQQPQQPQPQYNNQHWSQPPLPSFNNSWAPPSNNGGWGPSQPSSGGQFNTYGPTNINSWQTGPTDPQQQELRRLIDQLYLRYDSDRSGTLDKREMVRAMNELLEEFGADIRINQRQSAQLIRAVDTSGDGKVNKQEFLRMLQVLLSGSDY